MFFDDILVENEDLRRAWRVGNNIPEDDDENVSLPKICEQLDRWVGSEDPNPRRRLSLRTSAVLIDGTAMLYRNGIDNLLEDIAKLDDNIVFRNRPRSENTDGNDTSISIKSSASSEQMMHQAIKRSDTSIENHNGSPITPLKEPYRNHSYSTCSEQNINKRQSIETIGDPEARLPKKRNVDRITDQSEEHADESHDYSLSLKLTNEGNSDMASEQSKSTDQMSADEEVSDHVSLNRLNNDRSSARSSPKGHATSERQMSDPKVSEQSKGISKARSLSPTFTDLFDLVVSLPNYDIEGTAANIDVTGRETDDRRTTTERASSRNTEESNEIHSDTYRRTTTERNKKLKNCNLNCKRNSDGVRVTTEEIPDSGTVAGLIDDGSQSDQEGSIILGSTQNTLIQRKKKSSRQGRKKKDIATQTIPFCPSMSERENTIDESLPFGCLIIYKANSRKPSIMVCASLSADVNNLV